MLCIRRNIIPLPDDKVLTQSKLKALVEDDLNVAKMMKFVFDGGKKHYGKKRNCWLSAFSPFPTMFSRLLP